MLMLCNGCSASHGVKPKYKKDELPVWLLKNFGEVKLFFSVNFLLGSWSDISLSSFHILLISGKLWYFLFFASVFTFYFCCAKEGLNHLNRMQWKHVLFDKCEWLKKSPLLPTYKITPKIFLFSCVYCSFRTVNFFIVT